MYKLIFSLKIQNPKPKPPISRKGWSLYVSLLSKSYVRTYNLNINVTFADSRIREPHTRKYLYMFFSKPFHRLQNGFAMQFRVELELIYHLYHERCIKWLYVELCNRYMLLNTYYDMFWYDTYVWWYFEIQYLLW